MNGAAQSPVATAGMRRRHVVTKKSAYSPPLICRGCLPWTSTCQRHHTAVVTTPRAAKASARQARARLTLNRRYNRNAASEYVGFTMRITSRRVRRGVAGGDSMRTSRVAGAGAGEGPTVAVGKLMNPGPDILASTPWVNRTLHSVSAMVARCSVQPPSRFRNCHEPRSQVDAADSCANQAAIPGRKRSELRWCTCSGRLSVVPPALPP